MNATVARPDWKRYVPFAGRGYAYRTARWTRALAARGLVLLHLDRLYLRLRPWRPWAQVRIDPQASLQEAVLFPDRPEVNDALRELHATVHQTAALLPAGARVLEIGSGTGLYVKELEDRFDVTGVDISPAMIDTARRECPRSQFVLGDFLDLRLEGRFHLIYSISVLQYFPASTLNRFFRKVHDLLHDDGILLLQYPRALDPLDAWYHKLHYVRHPPQRLERIAARYLTIQEHRGSYTGDCCGQKPHPQDALVFGQLLLARKSRSRSG